jgi:hypothetical protein
MRPYDGGVLEVDPHRVQVVAQGLRARHLVMAAQRRVCEGIEVSGEDSATVAAELESFTSGWASAMMALSRELDLLGVELGTSAQAVAAVDLTEAQ